MTDIDYNGRTFVGVENYDDGDLTTDTVFRYHQRGRFVWGSFQGGGCAVGNLVARMENDGSLHMSWHYLSTSGELARGICYSRLEVLADGRYRLHENWETSNGIKGTSVVEETSGE